MANQTVPAEVKHMVIKLGLIKENAEPEFRRILFNSLPFHDLNEATAVNQIKKYAVLLLKGAEGFDDPDTVELEEETIVNLMYTDTDNDKVLIFTDNDVISALREYSSSGKVKILAEVKMKKKASLENPSLSSASTQTNIDSPATPQNIQVPETLSEAFLPSSSNRKNDSVPAAVVSGAPAPVVPDAPAPIVSDMPDASAERPFIHGRHTCDGCLATPIIGKRFHAVNRTDHDLCERCYSSYTEDGARFEEVIDDRDVAVQDRWHERRARQVANN